MKIEICSRFAVALTLILMLLLGLVGTGYGMARPGKPGEQGVTITASVADRLIFELAGGETVSLVADPLDKPTAEGRSAFTVRTNVGSYAIVASFGAFPVVDTDYGLIANENFKIKSVPPKDGEGDAIFDWTVPGEEMTILSGETGLTNGEQTNVLYQLSVDFAVPTGAASTSITYTATSSL